jgi:hypothetical protein
VISTAGVGVLLIIDQQDSGVAASSTRDEDILNRIVLVVS